MSRKMSRLVSMFRLAARFDRENRSALKVCAHGSTNEADSRDDSHIGKSYEARMEFVPMEKEPSYLGKLPWKAERNSHERARSVYRAE